MKEFLSESIIFGAVLSLAAYEIGLLMKKKFKLAILNPLLIGTICVIGFLLIFRIDYEEYNEGAKYISYLLTPATVCLAVPLYEQLSLLKELYGSGSGYFIRCFGKSCQCFGVGKAV